MEISPHGRTTRMHATLLSLVEMGLAVVLPVSVDTVIDRLDGSVVLSTGLFVC